MGKLMVRYRPSVAQHHVEKAIREGRAKVTAMFGGIGSGKTAVGAQVTRRVMMEWAPRSVVGIVVPSYKTFRQVTLPEIRKFWPGEGKTWELRHPGGNPEIVARCKGGGWSTALIRSAQHERIAEDIRGPTWSFMWGDEAGTWNAGKLAWDLAIGRLRRSGIPGWWPRALITGSPRWGWMNEVFGIGGPMPEDAWRTGYYSKWDTERPGPQGAFYVRASDTGDNKTNDPYYRRFLELNYGEDFARQELCGDFVAPTGALFPRFYPHIHIIPHRVAMEMYARCQRRVAGQDWGFSSLAALVAAGIDGDNRLVVVRDWQGTEHTADMLGRKALEWRHGTADAPPLYTERFHMDPSNPDGACDSWEGRVSGSVKVPGACRAHNARDAGWNALRSAMRLESALRHPVGGFDTPASYMYVSDKCPHVIEAMRYLRRKPVKEGEEVTDDSDLIPPRLTHIADAVRYMYFSEVGGFQVFGGSNADY